MNFIEKEVKNYFDCHIKHEEKFVLALSGGPDSMALYLALKKVRKPSLVLHIHHGMRKESDQELEILKKLVENDSIQFRVEKIENFDFLDGNIEDRLREERLKKYALVMNEYGISHLLTGHQKGDAEENIFKRLFEGSYLFKLGKILKPSYLCGFIIHRPLISIEKTQLIDYLKSNNQTYFEDITNLDTQFLRSRLRINLFPYINKVFGKNIEGKLFDLGLSLNEVEQYLNSKCQKYFDQVIIGPLGILLKRVDIEPIELRYVLISLAEQLLIKVTKDQISTLVDLYYKRASNKRVIFSNYTIFIEKTGIIFYNHRSFSLKSQITNLDESSSDFSDFWTCKSSLVKKELVPYFIRKKFTGLEPVGLPFSLQIE